MFGSCRPLNMADFLLCRFNPTSIVSFSPSDSPWVPSGLLYMALDLSATTFSSLLLGPWGAL